MESYYSLERQAAQKRRDIAAEVRRDRMGADAARAARVNRVALWQRLAALSPVSLLSSRRSTPGETVVTTG